MILQVRVDLIQFCSIKAIMCSAAMEVVAVAVVGYCVLTI